MKILYYNWIQFDTEHNTAGGVNMYQKNLIDYLVNNTQEEVFFLSAGWRYNPLHREPYVRETSNMFGERCKTFELVNSPIMAPAYTLAMNLPRFIDDSESVRLFDAFITAHGPFDVIHFNNFEGISINALRLREKYSRTRFIVSIHNYLTICPLAQYFQLHKRVTCRDDGDGRECMSCVAANGFDGREYARRTRAFYRSSLTGLQKPFKLLYKLAAGRSAHAGNRVHNGTPEQMQPEHFMRYRRHNVAMLNSYADAILCVSDRVHRIMLDHGVDARKLVTSYIGTKLAEGELKHSVATSTQPFTIAYLGQKRVDKGFFFLLDALSTLDRELAQHIDVVLAVRDITPEDYEAKLANFNSVTTHNGFTHSQLPDILRKVNLGMIPVLWEDNLPQIAIEMVACGVPILCSDFGGASELCRSALFRYEGGNTADFHRKLTTLLESPALLNEYWAQHPDLTTMERHVAELTRLYRSSC